MTRLPLIFLVIFSCSYSANAQLSKGSYLLGGQLSFSSTTNSYPSYYPLQDQKSNSGNFEISIGKVIRENAVLGINISYNPYSYNYEYYGNIAEPLRYSNNGYSIGIFYRLYKGLGKDFFLFGEAGASYTGSTQSGKDSTGSKVLSGSGSGGSVYVMPGISYKISKKFYLELTIPDIFNVTYNSTKTTASQQTEKIDQFNISTSLNANPLNALGIGFRLIL